LLLAWLTAVDVPATGPDPNTPVSPDAGAEAVPGIAGESDRSGGGVRGARGSGQDAELNGALPVSDAELERIRGLAPVRVRNGVESILGTDTRTRVYPTSYPSRANVLITFNAGFCTGAMIDPDTVLTAGHCVHSGGPGGVWYTGHLVYPGYDGSTANYGSCTVKSRHSVSGWTNSSNEAYDYGALRLNCTVGNTTGWYGMYWQTASLTNYPSIISGYPGDKPAYQQWISADKVRVTGTRQVFYKQDTIGGNSGSGVWEDRPSGSAYCSGACIYGVHAYGLHGSGSHSTHNHGTRIVQAVYNNYQTWKVH
jgi:glutamyl endopeptidase